ncbi:MAG: TetR/AcrR family transcriptional regulator, partial [Ktedonobacteraceae bacterium]|nr:TetR/AcrR family transcriptional regulator [Ktedonobacteraceae bacterium]
MGENASNRSTMTESRRHAILQAALKSFLTKGFTDTTMEDIRQLSGASMGSIYHHFENKEKLAFALFVEGSNDLNTHLSAAMADKQPREAIKDLVRAYVDWFEQNPDLGQYIIQASSTEYLGPKLQELRRTSETWPKQLLDWLTPFIEDGSIARLPAHLYISLILGPCREFVRRWLRERIPTELKEAREPLAEATWLMLAP